EGDGAGVKWADGALPPEPEAPPPLCATAPPPKRSPPRPPTPGLPLRRTAARDVGVPVCRTARTTGAAGAGCTWIWLADAWPLRVGHASKVTSALTRASIVSDAARSTPVVPRARRVTRFTFIRRRGSPRLIPPYAGDVPRFSRSERVQSLNGAGSSARGAGAGACTAAASGRATGAGGTGGAG